MKIACIDKTAADRIALQQIVDQAYEQCRDSVGHVSLTHTYPTSKDEALVSSEPDVFLVGPEFETEECYQVCRALKSSFPLVPIAIVIKDELFSIRTLRRFEKTVAEVFSRNEPAVRLVHKLSSFEDRSTNNKNGKLIVVNGAKGGVGATSLVSGLAHAAEAIGKSAIVLDLSHLGALVHYLAVERWQSPDFATVISDGLIPDEPLVERCTVVAPNGIHVFLPPAGGTDIREMWLRDPKRFEITLGVIDILREKYDAVIIDAARVEGVLSFALNARADSRVLLTSNEPASVHLLNSLVSQFSEIPGDGHLQVLINEINERGLSKDDVLDFLYINDHYEEEMGQLPVLKFDESGSGWIGTGNTFYTEGSAKFQESLENIFKSLLHNVVAKENGPARRPLLEGVKRFLTRGQQKQVIEKPKVEKRQGLPIKPMEDELNGYVKVKELHKQLKNQKEEKPDAEIEFCDRFDAEDQPDFQMYEPPKPVEDASRGKR